MTIRGLIGTKLGMTRIFNKGGVSVPVTVIAVKPHYITQIKNVKKDRYSAVQVTTGNKNINCANKPIFGHLKKSGVIYSNGLWEFRVLGKCTLSVGDVITVDVFKDIKKVDIRGVSKGKGFAGTIKRWNFHMQDASHGNSLSHRAPGSIGQNQTPGKVFKGKKMAGQLGNDRVTIQNLDVINVSIKRNLLLIKGSVPGFIGNFLYVTMSVKSAIL